MYVQDVRKESPTSSISETGQKSNSAATEALLDSDAAEKLSPAGKKALTSSYNPKIATQDEYAEAFGALYARAKKGLEYNEAVARIGAAATKLTDEAKRAAYNAGSANVARKKPGLYRAYSNNTFENLGSVEKSRLASAQIQALEGLAHKTGHAIRIVDSIGGKGNGMYNQKTGEITIALDAQDGAYLYVGMHELTHAIKTEHADKWNDFADMVTDALVTSGVDVDAAIEYQKATFGYDTDAALEEVICNSAPAVLENENVLRQIYEKDRTLFEKIIDCLKDFIDSIRAVGDSLQDSKSWAQLGAMSRDQSALESIYEHMMEILEEGGESSQTDGIEKYSPREGYTENGIPVYTSNFPEGTTRKERQDHILDLVKNVWSENSIKLEIVKNGRTHVITANFDPRVDAESGAYSDATKLAYGNRKGTMADQKTTEKLADDFPEIIGASSYVSSKAETGKESEPHQGVMVWHYFANHIGFINGKGGYAEYNVNIDVKEKTEGQYVYAVGAEKIKGSEQTKAPNLRGDPKTILASGSGIAPAIANTIISETGKNVNEKHSKKEPRTDAQDRSLTAQQAQYFADSKARDEEGRLLSLYHGTTGSGFTTFEQRGDRGFFFTNKRAAAEPYAGENAVLVDSQVSNKDAGYSSFYHTLYAYVDDGNSTNLIRLTVEQIDDYDGGNLIRRSYKLNNMEVAPNERNRLQAGRTKGATTFSISDLFNDVNRIDKNFNPKKARLVANEDGSPKMVYHGTDEAFNTFDMTKGRSTMDIQGAFFSPWEDDARGYGKNTRAFYISLQNPADEQTGYKALRMFQGQNDAGVKARKWLEAQGYDGVNNGDEEYIVFNSTQIKSATDNIGTFDPDNPDTLYSLRDTDETVQGEVDTLEAVLNMTVGHQITAAEATTLAQKMLKVTNSTYDAEQLAAEIAEIYDFAEGGDPDMAQIDDEQTSLMAKVMAKSRTLDLEHEEMAKPIRKRLRESTIRLTETQQKEAESMMGSAGQYRKALFGRVPISKSNGEYLDVVWPELTEFSPTLFPADTAEGDMPRVSQISCTPYFDNSSKWII